MRFLNENNQIVELQSLSQLLKCGYMWQLELTPPVDYTLSEIRTVEQSTAPAVELLIRGVIITLPANWYVLVCDPHTCQLDVVLAGELSNNTYSAVVYGPNRNAATTSPIVVVNYVPYAQHIYPTFNRSAMLCYPLSPDEWINASFSDTYNRFVRNMCFADLTN